MSRWTVCDVFKLDGLPAFDPTSDEDRFAALRQISTTHEPGQQIPDGRITTIAHQPVLHQAFVMFFFLMFVLGPVFWVPLSLIYLGLFGSWSAFAAAFAATLVAIFIPAPRAVWSLTCSVAKWFTRYTSYRIVWEGTVEDLSFKDKPVFGLVPPHGVFPMQNILVHLVLPAITGRYVRGMAADALLAVPLTRHVLCAIGGIPATRAAALQALDLGFLSGVSPDGIAGIFEVNSDDEVVVILSRTGIYKIACKAGTPIWVTYTFGTTKAFSAWFDTSGRLASISRRLKMSLFFLWGRFGLPVPRRVPLTTVVAKPIPVPHTDNPTDEQINMLQKEVLAALQRIFETHKHAYGWADKKLVFK